MESSQTSDYHEKLQLNGSENFPGELQITLQSAINSSPSKSEPWLPNSQKQEFTVLYSKSSLCVKWKFDTLIAYRLFSISFLDLNQHAF